MAHLRCKHCDTLLGETTVDEFITGPVAFDQSITMRCLNCSRKNRWIGSGKISELSKGPPPVNLPDSNRVAELIKTSLTESERTWLAGETTQPRRDAITDATEAKKELALYENLAKSESEEKMKKPA
jgi:hypothetical protein